MVDNGSSDESLNVIKRHRNQVKVIRLDHNEGFGRAVNKGIRSTRSELVFVLNNDTVLEPDCLARIVEAADSYPSFGFFAPKIYEHDNPERIYAAGLMLSVRGYGNRSQRFRLHSIDTPIEVFGACGAAAVYRREILEDVGLFNEDFFFLYEDLELSYRHQLRGYKCLYLPSARLAHHGSATIHQFFSQAIGEAVKNSFITTLTCTPTPLLKTYALDILKFYLRFWWLMVRKGFAVPLLTGLSSAVSRILSILKTRARLQAQSVIDPNYLISVLYDGKIYVNFPDEVVEL